MEISESRAERCDVSLVTGSVRTLGTDEEVESQTGTALEQRNKTLTVAHTAGENIQQTCSQEGCFVSVMAERPLPCDTVT